MAKPISLDANKLMQEITVTIYFKNINVLEWRLKIAKTFFWLAMKIAGVGKVEFEE